MLQNNSPNSPVLLPNFFCKECDYGCSKKSDFDKHTTTDKHKKNTSNSLSNESNTKFSWICNNCKKIYKSRVGLWRHTKICINEIVETEKVLVADNATNKDLVQLLIKEHSDFKKENSDIKKENLEFKTMIVDLVKSNTELQKQMLEVCKNIQASKNTTTINSNNKTTTFNMQVFLNETCKDAMNLKEFVDSIKLTLADFEMVGEKGLIDGLSSIIINSLRATDLNLRPIHCSDVKREVMYVKDNDKWEKEGPKNDKIRHVVQNVEHKNIRLLVDYCNEHVDCMDPESPSNDNYLHLSSVATSGTADHLDKIITKIAKEVVIDK